MRARRVTGVPDDVTGVVHAGTRTAAERVLCVRTEIDHHAVRPQKRVPLPVGRGALPDDLPHVIDLGGLARGAAECSQVLHYAVLPQEGMARAIRGQAPTDDLAGVVEIGSGAVLAAERAEVDRLVRRCRKIGGDRTLNGGGGWRGVATARQDRGED